MAFGIGTNSLPPDAGMVRGKQKEVACECWFTSTGKITPLMQGEDWTRNHYLSLGGTAPRALLGFLHDHPAVTHVSLCLDNDAAGLAGMESIREAVRADGELSLRIKSILDNPPPESGGKDYNALLQQKITALRMSASSREKAEGGRQRAVESSR